MKSGFFILLLVVFASGCSAFGLRDDFKDGARQDEPVSGGMWPERQSLDSSDLESKSRYDDSYDTVGHTERDPSYTSHTARSSSAWSRRQQGRQLASNPDESARTDGNVAPPAPPPRYKRGDRASREDFIDDSSNEGSLWASDGQTNYFFTKNSVKGVGDIITVNLEDQFIKDVGSEMKRNLTEDESDMEVTAAQEKLKSQPQATNATKGGGTRAPAGTPEDSGTDTPVRKATFADVDLSKSVGLNAGDTMMAEILERYPSGNYKIRATKRLQYHGGTQMLTMVGVARGSDINDTDTMNSGKLYEYKLSIAR